MILQRYRVFLWSALLVFPSWLSLAFLDPDPGSGVVEKVALGYFLGSLFGHTTLAATWTAFGPGRLVWRLPLSLIWVASLAAAIAINVGLNGGPREAFVVIGACLLVQWVLLQFPLWGLALGYGIRLRHFEEADRGFNHREHQFGIRQLMIVTTIVAVIFGIGRVAVGQLGEHLNLGRGEAPIFIFLAVAAIVFTLPLLLAALMRQLAVPGVLLTLALIGVATASELPLLKALHSGPGPKAGDFIAINAFTAAFTLAIAVIVRLNGYSLATPQANG